ncbi:hypothetical protein MHH60_23235 [Paenibacillus sp. FSL H7-0716]|uniref:hypothetical protein n=1 Tax=Paenibacillus TaxID=44249 RepID=UPI00117DF302|nr:hypothetical protein [Paenibacillus odorifer]
MAINGQITAAESVSICRALVEVGRKLVKGWPSVSRGLVEHCQDLRRVGGTLAFNAIGPADP